MIASRPDRLIEALYPESLFGGFTNVDGTIAFYTRVNALIGRDATVLDVGCGRGSFGEDPVPARVAIRDLRSRARRVIGLDVDLRAAGNPYVHEFRLAGDSKWPLEDHSIDVCVCDWVVEHVGHPTEFIAESHRVLKRGGYLCIRTLNRLSYVGILSRLIPNDAHSGLLRRLQVDRSPADIFPTYYRCNTKRQLESTLVGLGFASHVYGHNPEPTYLQASPALFRLGVWHQRYAPRASAVTLLAFARRVA